MPRPTPLRPALPPTNPDPPRLLYTIRETAEWLGVSVWTVRQMLKARELRAIRRGRLVRVSRNEIERWREQAEAADDRPRRMR